MKTEFKKRLLNYYNGAGLSIEEQAWAIWQDAWQAQQARINELGKAGDELASILDAAYDGDPYWVEAIAQWHKAIGQFQRKSDPVLDSLECLWRDDSQ